MRKKLFFATVIVVTSIIVGVNTYKSQSKVNKMSALTLENVEALSECEITKSGSVKYRCTGNSGHCSISHMGYTLTCSGIKTSR